MSSVFKSLNILRCTLTGVDEHTDLNELANLSKEFPKAEWGLLYSPKLQGSPGRYPSIKFLEETLESLPEHVNVALHICGKGVSELLSDPESNIRNLVMLLQERGDNNRIQLNFNQAKKPISLSDLYFFLSNNSNLNVITQYNEANINIWRFLSEFNNHHVLFDSSGGQGKLPGKWPWSIPGVFCGYAGGLGPDTLDEELHDIRDATNGHNIWVDMESSLRGTEDNNFDLFDLTKCRQCLEIVTRRSI